MKQTAEEWRPVVGYEGRYEISDCGRIRSVDRMVSTIDGRRYLSNGRVLRPSINSQGRPVVNLNAADGGRTQSIGQLVGAAFLGPTGEGQVVRHLNGNPQDNRVANLAHGTQSQNMMDCVRHGTHNRARRERCKNGHRLVAPNLRESSKSGGGRECRACAMARAVQTRARAAGRPVPSFSDVATEKYEQIMAGEATTQVRGERQGAAKLTEVKVREILSSAEEGSALAKRLGVSESAVSHVRLGKTWKHIPRPAEGVTSSRRQVRWHCSVDGCDRPHSARGMCGMHYKRQRKTGTTQPCPVDRSIKHGTHWGSFRCIRTTDGPCVTCRQFLADYHRKRRAAERHDPARLEIVA